MGSEWAGHRLGDLVLHQKGHAFKSKDYREQGHGIVRVSDFTDRSVATDSCNYLAEELAPNYDSVALKQGDVVIATVGSWPTNPASVVGKTIRVPKEADSFLLNQNAVKLTANEELDQTFLFHLLKTESFGAYIVSAAQGSASQASITLKSIFDYSFQLPPLPEQKAIAHILGTLDDKIELNRRMNATLEGMAQALFKSWFVDFDPVIDNALAAGNPIPDELAPRAEVRKKALGERSSSCVSLPKDGAGAPSLPDFPATFQFTEELGWIPEGWEAMAVSEAISINSSMKLKKGDVAPFADMKALPTSGYAIDGVIKKAYSGGAKFQNGDVLLARITPCLENGKTGIVNFLTDDDPVGFGSTEFIVLRGDGDLSTAFIACLARDSDFRKHCEQSMIGSSGRQRVHNSCFDSYHLALPKNQKVVSQFNALAVPAFAKANSQSNESTTLTKLRDTLLPKLISGELRLPEAEQLTEGALA